MKFIVLGTSETTLNLVQGLKETKHKLISLISLDKRNLPNNSVDNRKFAKEKKARLYTYYALTKGIVKFGTQRQKMVLDILKQLT